MQSWMEPQSMYQRSQVDTLRAKLAVEGFNGQDTVYPEDSQASFYETSEDKSQRYLTNKQNKLKNGIKAIDGIEYVDVNLYIPDDNAFVLNENKSEASASLILKIKQGYSALDQKQVEGIVQYVAKSVKGLKVENISVIDENGRSLVVDKGDLGNQITTQMEMQNTVQKNIEDSVKKFLEAPFGANNVQVKAAVKLDFNNMIENSTTYVAPNQETNTGILRSMQEVKKNLADSTTGGTPGTDSNGNATQYVDNSNNANAKYNEASSTVNYEINEIKRQIVKEMGNIQYLSVSVILNENTEVYDAKKKEWVTAKRNVTDELKANTKALVSYSIKGFFPELTAEQIDKMVDIKTMPFDTTVKDKIKNQQKSDNTSQILQLVGTVLVGLLAFAAFGAAIFLFLRTRSGGFGGGGGEKVTITTADGKKVAVKKEDSVPVAEIDTEDKNEVKKQIQKFVGQKPDAVAQLLKSWLNDE